ncbi:MAG: universal stress protein [Sphingomonadaceae bacterium]|uniref:universal stress protein n=1 Tax=Thermaurantiacus sp. TaxID=2820283 RepID=UPI00298EF2E9|nr:universal stress protein [Thermaurantiacus sp.]MCS6987099.1 universal stress protein [Sphingomonadaceae bacterium]MDW8415563.1 universal stress protein [Thermaurantiacus sp.]
MTAAATGPELGDRPQGRATSPRGVGRGTRGDLLPSGAVIACIDRPADAPALLTHGRLLARVLNAPLALVQVLDTGPANIRVPDPRLWAARRREVRATLERLARDAVGEGESPPVALLLEGIPAREIGRVAREARARVIVIGRQQGGGAVSVMGSTARELLDRLSCSLLLLPPDPGPPFAGPAPASIVVPLDGSEWAEVALPTATAIARRQGAAVRLVHALEPPCLAGRMPPTAGDLELERDLSARAEARARGYLAHVERMLQSDGHSASATLLAGQDPRAALLAYLRQDPPDLVVISARGHSRSRLADLALGGVAAYLAARSEVPLLIVQGGVERPLVPSAEPAAALHTTA